MTFHSFSYFVFLPIVFLFYSFAGAQYRWMILLLSSYIFYGFLFKPILLLVMTVVIVVTFFIARLVDRSEDRFTRSMFLWAGIFINLALLVYFKYLPFLAQTLNFLMKSLGLGVVFGVPETMVSLGLSFYIFQAISYLADVYFRIIRPEQHLGYFALFLAFFPRLMQGPIERAGSLIPQLKAEYKINPENIHYGMLLFALGLFKKIVFADRISPFVDDIYGNVQAFSGLSLILATYAYAFQLYMDFSGYTDMALGTARLFNINLTPNFKSPFLATSVSDFWRRWHISFSRWVFEYIFEPLQMLFRNMGIWGTLMALFCTFILVGIWHGAGWTFVVFGLIHGIYLSASIIYKPYQKLLHRALGIEKTMLLKIWQTFVTFNLVALTIVFFRAENFFDAVYVLTNMFNGAKDISFGFFFSQGIANLITLALVVIIYPVINAMIKRCAPASFVKLSIYKKCLIYYSFITMILILAKFKHTDFIYLKF